MSPPQCSVLMSVYNGEAYLESAVRSVQAQTLKDFELVIVNDGSTDRTAAILDRLAQDEPRLRVIHQENTGIAPAVNAGLAVCQADLVARMDSDDLAEPDRLAVQTRYMAEHPDVVAAGTAVTFIDHRDRRLTINRPPTDHDAIDRAMLKGHCSIWQTSSIIRRATLEQIGGYNTAYRTAEDIDLWLRLAEVGRLANLDRPLQSYRIHDQSITAEGQAANRELCRRACDEAAARRGVPSAFEAGEPWRHNGDRASRALFATRYGWWAWHLGEMATARHYALQAIKNQPRNPEPWKLLLKSFTGKPNAAARAEEAAG